MQDEHDARNRMPAGRPAPDARPTIGVEVEEALFLDESMEYLPAGRPPQGGSPFDLFADEESPEAAHGRRAPLGTCGPGPWSIGPERSAVDARHRRHAISPRLLAILSIAAALAAFAAVRAWQMLAR